MAGVSSWSSSELNFDSVSEVSASRVSSPLPLVSTEQSLILFSKLNDSTICKFFTTPLPWPLLLSFEGAGKVKWLWVWLVPLTCSSHRHNSGPSFWQPIVVTRRGGRDCSIFQLDACLLFTENVCKVQHQSRREEEGASYGNQFVRIKQWVATLNVAWAETWKPSGYGNIKWGCLNKTDILISEWTLSEFWVVTVSLLFCTHHQVVGQGRGGGLQWSVVSLSSWCPIPGQSAAWCAGGRGAAAGPWSRWGWPPGTPGRPRSPSSWSSSAMIGHCITSFIMLSLQNNCNIGVIVYSYQLIFIQFRNHNDTYIQLS